MTNNYKVCAECEHINGPGGYIANHNWAKEMSKTHKQIKCDNCGLFKVWVKK